MEEQVMPFMPRSKIGVKLILGGVGQRERQGTKFLCCFSLWTSGEILGNGLHLMELAILYGNACMFKNLRNTSFSINDDAGDGPSIRTKLRKSFGVDPWCFLE